MFSHKLHTGPYCAVLSEYNADLEFLREEVKLLRKLRGLDCDCRGNCPTHNKGLLASLEVLPSKYIFPEAPQQRAKRKGFDQLTPQGKRKSMKEVRGLLKKKGTEYGAPVSRMAAFVIQQVH